MRKENQLCHCERDSAKQSQQNSRAQALHCVPRLLRRAYAPLAMTIFFIIITTPAPAQMCERDWLSVWRNASGSLQNSPWPQNSAFTHGARYGTWAVTAIQANTGRQTVNGLSQCNASSTVSDNNADGANCWCRIINPTVGPWVFRATHVSAAVCAGNCTHFCAFDFRGNATFRATVLDLP